MQWQKTRLGDVAEITSSKRIFASQYNETGIPFYRSREIIERHDARDISEPLFIAEETYEDIKRRFGVPQEGDILLTSVGTLGVPYHVKGGDKFYFKDGNLTWFRNFAAKVDSKYIYYWLDSRTGRETLIRRAIGSSQPAFTIEILRKIPISLPPLPTQSAIAEKLGRYDALIENNTRRIAILENKVEQLYKEWFVRRQSSGHSTAKSATLSLGDIIEVSRGLSYTSSEIDTDAGVQLINLKNIQPYGGFRYDGSKRFDGKYKPDQIVVRGDLVMGVTDMTQDRRAVGSVALMPPLKETSVISADLIKIESKIDKLFLYAMFRYGGLSRYISQFANGANVLHLRPQSIMGIKVQVPSEEAMERLSARLRPMIALMDNLNEQNALLSRQRDLLLPRLMSGRVKP